MVPHGRWLIAAGAAWVACAGAHRRSSRRRERSRAPQGPNAPSSPTPTSGEGEVEQFASGKRVGTWRQFDGEGTLLGSFPLDPAGTGVEVVHDALGHSKRGAVVAGRREGTWTLQGADGKIAATELWSKGTLVRQTGRAPWDPPMIDPADACPDEPAASSEDRDGCLDPAAHGQASGNRWLNAPGTLPNHSGGSPLPDDQ